MQTIMWLAFTSIGSNQWLIFNLLSTMTLRTFCEEIHSTRSFAPLYYSNKRFILSQELDSFVFALVESCKVPANAFLHLVKGHLDVSPSFQSINGFPRCGISAGMLNSLPWSRSLLNVLNISGLVPAPKEHHPQPAVCNQYFLSQIMQEVF